MAYQTLTVIKCQSHHYKGTIVVLFNLELKGKRVYAFPKCISLKVNAIGRLKVELVYHTQLATTQREFLNNSRNHLW